MAAPESAARKAGASQSRTGLLDVSRSWLQHHRLSASDSLRRIVISPVASCMTWLVIGIALALPAGLVVLLDNANRLSVGWDSPAQMSAFLAADVSSERAVALREEFSQTTGVATVVLLARDAALEEFRALSGFADVLSSLDENPLPDVLLITPDPSLDSGAVGKLREELGAAPEVTEVVLDMAWLERLQQLMALIRRLVLALGLLFALGVMLILGNTIRLAIESRREEIEVVKLVGGSNGFVRRPFLYTGLWYGVGGGLSAGLLVIAALAFLKVPAASLAALYESSFSITGLGVMGVLNLVVLGGLLGLAGAWLAVARHLSKVEPK